MASERQKQKEETAAPDKAAREAVQNTDPPEEAEKFPVVRLCGQSGAFFGQPPHVVAGALSGVNRKELTLEEAEAAIEKWLDSPVKEA